MEDIRRMEDETQRELEEVGGAPVIFTQASVVITLCPCTEPTLSHPWKTSRYVGFSSGTCWFSLCGVNSQSGM